jgi:hypothetical protein
MRRNKDTLKQILRDAKTSHTSEVENLKAKLEQAREAIGMVLDLYNAGYAMLTCESLEEDDVEVGIYLKEHHAQQLKKALR